MYLIWILSNKVDMNQETHFTIWGHRGGCLKNIKSDSTWIGYNLIHKYYAIVGMCVIDKHSSLFNQSKRFYNIYTRCVQNNQTFAEISKNVEKWLLAWTGNPYWKGRISTVYLLVQTSLNQLIFKSIFLLLLQNKLP